MNIDEIRKLKQLNPNSPDLIADNFGLLAFNSPCPQCNKETQIIGIVLPKFKERVPLDEDLEPEYVKSFNQEELDAWCNTEEAHQWDEFDYPVLVTRLSMVSENAIAALRSLVPHAFSKFTKLENHCNHCQKTLSDEYCFEIGGPFIASCSEDISLIKIVDIDEKIECKGNGVWHSLVYDIFH